MYDIKRSRFGISPKGAGYDCQRHYEILGNAVLCIYLDRAAPRILREQFLDGINCLTFDSLDSLKRKIDACKDSEALIQRGRQSLHEKHLSSCRAKQLLDRITALTGKKRRYHILSSLRYGYLPYYSREIVERAKLKLMRRWAKALIVWWWPGIRGCSCNGMFPCANNFVLRFSQPAECSGQFFRLKTRSVTASPFEKSNTAT